MIETILTLLGSSWHWLALAGGLVLAVLGSYWSGKKTGTVETQAKADVAAADQKAETAEKSASARIDTVKAVQNVKENINSQSDSNVDNSLLDKWTKD